MGNNWLPIEELLHQMEAYAVDYASGKGASIIVPSSLWDEAIQRIKSAPIVEPSKLVGNEVERVAKAIWEANHDKYNKILASWDSLNENDILRLGTIESARAAIAAIHGDETKLREALAKLWRAAEAYEDALECDYAQSGEYEGCRPDEIARAMVRIIIQQALASQQGE